MMAGNTRNPHCHLLTFALDVETDAAIAPFAHGAFHAEMLQVLVMQVQAHVQSLHRYSLSSDM